MKTNKLLQGVLSKTKTWRIRITAGAYFAFLMTLLAPISPVHAPSFDWTEAHAENVDYKAYAETMVTLEYQWANKEFICLSKLWGKESAWNPTADNPESTAYGIAQMLNEKSDNGLVQIANGLRYIEHRYTTPCNAWEFWQRKNWY
jgi:hypothetical protein